MSGGAAIGLSRVVRASVIRRGLHAAFFNRVRRAAAEARYLVIVSPWISSFKGEPYALDRLAAIVIRRRLRTYVFTRPPENRDQVAAAGILARCPTVELVHNSNLHAKIYACVAPPPHGFAVLGSANMTTHAASMYEIGLLVVGVGGGESIVKDLASFGLDYLRTRPESQVIKRIEARRNGYGV